MDKISWLCLRRAIIYEIDYLYRRFRLIQASTSIVFFVVLVIISLSDTQSFFIGENSPIPDSWKFLKNRNTVSIISIFIITISYLLPWLSDFLKNQTETKELATAVEENLVPAIEIELKTLKRRVRQKFRLGDTARVSIFVPVRRGFCQWSLQMVCRTNNVLDKELRAEFQLDEGVIGYTFLKNQKHSIECINVSDPNCLPASYKPLMPENEPLINRDIQAVLVAAAFQEGSIAGLLAIDTANSQDILKMEDKLLHDEALDWIIARSKTVKLLWRMKNNV